MRFIDHLLGDFEGILPQNGVEAVKLRYEPDDDKALIHREDTQALGNEILLFKDRAECGEAIALFLR